MMLFHHVYCLKVKKCVIQYISLLQKFIYFSGQRTKRLKQNHMFYSWLCVGDTRIKIKYVEDMHQNLYQVYIMSGWSVLCGIINEDLLS